MWCEMFLVLFLNVGTFATEASENVSPRELWTQLHWEFAQLPFHSEISQEGPFDEVAYRDGDSQERIYRRVVGKRGFHRQLVLEVKHSWNASRVCILQRLKPEIYMDPFEVGHIKRPVNLSIVILGPNDLETPAPGSRATLLTICYQSLDAPFPFNLSVPFHVKYQQPQFKTDVSSSGVNWLFNGAYVTFGLDPALLVVSGRENRGHELVLVGDQQKVVVPTGNTADIWIVCCGSIAFLLWSVFCICRALWQSDVLKDVSVQKKKE